MNQQQAENAVVISALVTAGMYGYRYFSEGESNAAELAKQGYIQKYKDFYGFGPVLPLGTWIPAFGVTYLALSIMAAASPQVGGTASVLVGTGAFFGNAKAVIKDLGVTTPKAAKTTTPGKVGTGVQPLTENHPPAVEPPELLQKAVG
jgi:hypothetical protein